MALHGKAFSLLLLTNVANPAFIVVETVHRTGSLHDLIITLPEDYCLGCYTFTFEDSNLRTSHLQFLPALSHLMQHLKHHSYCKSLLELLKWLGEDNMKLQCEQRAPELLREWVKNYPQCRYMLCSWLHCWFGMVRYVWSTCLLLLWCRCELGSPFLSWVLCRNLDGPLFICTKEEQRAVIGFFMGWRCTRCRNA
jgi:hypothetical protein